MCMCIFVCTCVCVCVCVEGQQAERPPREANTESGSGRMRSSSVGGESRAGDPGSENGVCNNKEA